MNPKLKCKLQNCKNFRKKSSESKARGWILIVEAKAQSIKEKLIN